MNWIIILQAGVATGTVLLFAALGELLAEFGALPPAEGFERVYFPGQVEAERQERRRVEGIPIDPGLYRELVALGGRLGVPLPG